MADETRPSANVMRVVDTIMDNNNVLVDILNHAMAQAVRMTSSVEDITGQELEDLYIQIGARVNIGQKAFR